MDYTKVPRSLIYKDRNDLKDYDVLNPESVDYHLFKLLKNTALLRMEEAKESALQCFNNAYYICALIQLEEFPDLCIVEYEEKLIRGARGYPHDVCAASMAMVYQLLPIYDSRWDRTSDWARALHDNFNHRFWLGKEASKTFYTMVGEGFPTFRALPGNRDLAPRDIIEAIENVSEKALVYGKEYVCEALSRLDDPRKWTYGLDMAIARLKDLLHEYVGGDAPEYDYEMKISDAIVYYNIHHPSKKKTGGKQTSLKKDHPPQNDDGQENADIEQLTARINKLQQENDELKKRIAELVQPVESLTAAQKVRMELAFRLLQAAGATDEVLEQQNNKQKAARVMSVLLDIHNNNSRGNPAQTCATYISARDLSTTRHKEMIDIVNPLLKELKIDIQL